LKFKNFHLLILLLLLTPGLYAQSSKLDNFEKNASGGSGSQSSDSDTDSEDNSANYDYSAEYTDEDDGFRETAIHLFLEGSVRLLFYFPEIENDIHSVRYSKYPYADSNIGIFTYDGDKKIAFRASFNYYQLNSNLTGYGIRTRLSPHPLVDLEFDYTSLKESVPNGYDNLSLYNFFINYNRIKSENFTLFWGLGLKGLSGNSSNLAFAFNVGSEIYLVAPVSFELNYNLGFFEYTTVDEFTLNLNLHLKQFKVYVGYQHFRAGDIKFPGFTAGLGIFL